MKNTRLWAALFFSLLLSACGDLTVADAALSAVGTVVSAGAKAVGVVIDTVTPNSKKDK